MRRSRQLAGVAGAALTMLVWAAAPSATQQAPPSGQAPQAPAQQQAPGAGQRPAPAAGQPAPGATSPSAKPAPAQPGRAGPPAPGAPQATGIALPADYVIGADDVIGVLFWRDTAMSVDNVTVRPDGTISIPLINDIQAAGLTPDQFRDKVTEAASKLVVDPNVTIVVRTINSRKVFITGQVGQPGTYPINSSLNVLQLIALAGGLGEWADGDNIVIVRTEGGRQQRLRFNYKGVVRGTHYRQNINLKPGDTVIVP